jgi:small subunit ribosomal protein S21
MRKRRQREFGLSVKVEHGNVEKALRKLKKKMANCGVLKEIRERQEYVKPSERRKKAKNAARRRWLKKNRGLDVRLF